MQGLQDLIPLLATLSLAGLIAAVGMDSSLSELFSLFRRPASLARAVLAVNVIVPVAAILLVPLFPLTPIARGAIILMAVSPVPPLVPGKQLKGGAEKSYAYALYTALACLSVVIVPVTVAILSRARDVSVSLGPFAVAETVALSVILPLAVGLALRRVLGDRAGPLSSLLRNLSMVLLLLILALLIIRLGPAMLTLVGNGTIAAMALVVAVGLAAGHLLGGPERADRIALAMAAGTRHPGIALMIAKAAGADRSVAAAIVGFLLVGVAVGVPYQVWLKRRPHAVTLGA